VPATLASRVNAMVGRMTGWAARHWRGRFYVGLAALFTLGICVDAAVSHYSTQMRLGAFDMLVRHRLRVPRPDPDIVIVDSDEASLAALGPEYGRWPLAAEGAGRIPRTS